MNGGNNKLTKYVRIANDMKEKIESGVYKPNDQLPFEAEMCDHYGVSRITVKKAMDLLVNEGLVVKRRGAGTFVKNITLKTDSEYPYSTSNQFSGFANTEGHTHVTSMVHDFQVVPANKEVAARLKIEEGDFVYYIERTRCSEGEPYVVEYTYMPIDVIPGVKREVLENSIYEHISKDLGLKIKSAHRTVRATLPTEKEEEYLKIDHCFPILEVEQVAFLDDGRIFEYSKSRHRGDRFELKTVSVQ